jgi:hypothetical protein
MRRAVLIAAACLAWSSQASAFQGSGQARLRTSAEHAGSSLLQRVRVVCRVYTTGNFRHTLYCEDGYVCAPEDKCAPGPAMLREMERQREEQARRADEVRKKLEEMERDLARRAEEAERLAEEARQRALQEQANEEARQKAAKAEAARRAEGIKKQVQKLANTPNPFAKPDTPASQPQTNPFAKPSPKEAAKKDTPPAPPPINITVGGNKPPARPQQLPVAAAGPSTNCSTITGSGMSGPGPANCGTGGSFNTTGASSPTANQAPQQSTTSNQPPRLVVLSPPQCSMCDVLKTVGEVLPDLAEKLKSIGPEAINEVEPPLFDGGPNTLHPFLPRGPLVPVTEPQTLPETIEAVKGVADDFKALGDLTDKDKEAEDYAQACQDGFLDAAWKAFTAKDGGYREKAKAAEDSLKKCWKAAIKHIEDTVANGGVDANVPLEDN